MVLARYFLAIHNTTKYCQTATFTYLFNTYSYHGGHSFDEFWACPWGSTCFLLWFSVCNLGHIAWLRIVSPCVVDNLWIVYDSSELQRHKTKLGFYLKLRFFPKWSLGSARTPKPFSVTIFCISILGLNMLFQPHSSQILETEICQG